MKINHFIASLAFGALSANCMATPSLSTFGENAIYIPYSNPTKIAHISLTDIFQFGEFRSPMKVSNTGEVLYTDPTGAALWSSTTNTYHDLPEVPPYSRNAFSKPSVDITTDGKQLNAGLGHFRLDESDNTYKLFSGGENMSSNGKLSTSWTQGAGKSGNIVQYPTYHTYGGDRLNFKYPDQGNDHGTDLSSRWPQTVETTEKGFYEEVQIIDIDGRSEVMLTNLAIGVPSGTFIEINPGYPVEMLDRKFDMALLNKLGQYVSKPYAVDAAVALSNNGQTALAYAENENCPNFNSTKATNCAILWHSDNDVTPLGNFFPYAMSGDATVVVGLSHHDENTPSVAVIWDAENGTRNFAEVMALQGIDLSNWTDLHPLDIAKDGSKIVGQGINPNGIAEGFMINLPEVAAQKWLTIANTDAQIVYTQNWLNGSQQTSSGESIQSSTEEGARASYTFTGDKVRLYGTKGLANGYFNLYIDNIFWDRFDTFACSEAYTDLIFESDYLGEGPHTLVIENAKTQSFASSGFNIGISKLEVETYAEAYAPASYQTGLVPSPSFQQNNIIYNKINQTPPNNHEDYNLPACDWFCSWFNQFGQRGVNHFQYDPAETSQVLSELIAADGSFTIETWIRNGDGIIDMAMDGQYFSVTVRGFTVRWPNGVDTSWYAATNLPMIASWSHVVVSGNWYSGQIEIYLNGQFAGAATLLDDVNATENKFRYGRSLPYSNKYLYPTSATAKLATYRHQLDANQVVELFNWPSQYGLDFAPNTSPEYTTRLPGCSQGCDPGQNILGLPVYFGSTAGGYGQVSGGGF